MQIPIARVKYIGDSQLILGGNKPDAIEHLWQARTRNYSVLDHDVRTQSSHRSESAFARFPDAFAIVRVIACFNRDRTIAKADRLDHRRFERNRVFYPFDFNDESGAG